MPKQNRPDFQSTKDILYAANTNQGITSSTHKTAHGNLAESVVFLEDEWPLAKKGPAPVRAAITTNIDRDTAAENGDTLDGVTLNTGDRILLAGQTDASQNGIYDVQASGVCLRSSDFSSGSQETVYLGAEVYVQEGSANAKKTFTLTAPTGTVTMGTSDQTWEELAPSTGGGGGGSNTKHIIEFNTNMTTPQETVVDYTKTLTETLKGVTGVSYETSDDFGVTWETKADIAAVNTELGTWSADGFLRVIVTDVTNTIGFVIIEET